MGGKTKQNLSAKDGVAQHVASIIDRFAVNCVLDVGANVGQWAVALRGAGYRGRILSFEPVGATFERLQANSREDHLWDTYCLALGAEEGILTLGRARHSGLSSVLKPSRYAQNRYGDGIEVVAEETVPVRCLDKLLPDLLPDFATVRLFLKMDTQGLDRQVFEGAKGVLPRIVGLQSELSVIPLYDGMTHWLEVLSMFTQTGYSPTGFFPVARRLPYGVLVEFDCVMARHASLTNEPIAAEALPVTVIVTAVDDSPALRRCLISVKEQAHELGGEVLLVINRAPDEISPENCRALQSLCDRLIFEPRIGKSNALNSAICFSRGKIIAFSNHNAEPLAGWLRELTAPLLSQDRNPALVGCGGPVLPAFPDGATPDWFFAMTEENPTNCFAPRHDLGAVPLDYEGSEKTGWTSPPGANCAYCREVFTSYHYEPRLGPNRQTGLKGGEDVLLGSLLLRDGYRLRYCPNARISLPIHPERMTEASLRRNYYLYGVESMRISRAMSRDSLKKTLKLRRKLRRNLRVLRLKMVFVLLPWPMRLPVIRLRWLTKYEFLRGQLDELKNFIYEQADYSRKRRGTIEF